MMFTIEAPAKINLTLEVLGKRSDGYHEIRSVIQTLDFSDTLQFNASKDIQVKSTMPGWVAEQSLVLKAVKLLQETTGCIKGTTIKISKRIPLMSGLGGDSSDAAAVLRGLNRLWELGLSLQKLKEMAQELGSDVSFFFCGGTALMAGRGEKITSLAPIPQQWVMLVVPNVPRLPGKTKQLYGMLQPSHYTDGKITDNFMSTIKSTSQVPYSLIFNTFENVVFTKGADLTNYRDHILKLGAPHVHLAGSGPALFAMMPDKSQAEDLLNRLKKQGMEAYLTETKNGL